MAARNNAANRDPILYRADFEFGFDPGACRACTGRCCSGASGRIWVNPQEIAEISRFLGIPEIDLIRNALQRIDNRLSIREVPAEDGFRCLFLEEGRPARCAVYPARPRQCRSFPFWDLCRGRGDILSRECPGIRMPALAESSQDPYSMPSLFSREMRHAPDSPGAEGPDGESGADS